MLVIGDNYLGHIVGHEVNPWRWPVGLMDKASASGAGDSRFESWAGHAFRIFYIEGVRS